MSLMRKTKHVLMNKFKRVTCLCAAASISLLALASLSGCEPNNHAVGDTGKADDIVHDGIDVEDIKLLIVGSKSASLDSKLLHLCEKSGLSAAYASVSDVKNANEAARDAIKSASEQPVSMILINNINIDASDSTDLGVKSNAGGAHVDLKARESWIDALKYARFAGIPVALVNPKNPPKDSTLYAAKLYIFKDLDNQVLFEFNRDNKSNVDKSGKIQHSSLLKIVQSLIDNTPHSRDVIINDKN